MTKSDRTLEDWLAYAEKLHPVGWDLGLARVSVVGERLGVLNPGDTTVLVAGTNGKGSTCEYLEGFAMATGLLVGKSTSPHLHKFNERIAINGVPVSDDDIATAYSAIDIGRQDTSLTYFEFAALASMLLFRDASVDVAILEIGLGGRLDAMNIANPDFCIITAISLDHQSWLGDTREAIGLEKAGIMRKGIQCLVSDRDPPLTLNSHARSIGAPLRFIGRDFDLDSDLDSDLDTNLEKEVDFALPRDSFIVAREAAHRLSWDTSQQDEIARTTRLEGRRSWHHGKCPVLFDVAHNEAAAQDFADYVRGLETRGSIHALVGMYKDKDVEAVSRPFRGLVKTWHLTDIDDPRAESANNLFKRLGALENVKTYANIIPAIAGIRELAEEDDLIIVFGSFPVVAGALQQFRKHH